MPGEFLGAPAPGEEAALVANPLGLDEIGAGEAGFAEDHAYTLVAGIGTTNLPPQPRIWPICRSEEHTSELQSLMRSSYAVFCLIKTKIHTFSSAACVSF